ncbi:MAG: proton-conducting transporter membrane subunit [Chitinivibrionales bacterium]
MLEMLPMVPIVFSLLCLLFPAQKKTNLLIMLIGTLLTSGYCLYVGISVARHGPISGLNGLLHVDHLSAFHLILMAVVFSTAALFAQNYFARETDTPTARSFSYFNALWLLSLAAMVVALIANNIIILWAAIEATTLFTCFLISLHKTKETFEAMWKYLLICGVGVSLALIGIVLILAAGERAGQSFDHIVLWTNLVTTAGHFNATLMKTGFVFIFIGFGTKAGLAPMHTWLPDAHSKAPAPVSAIFSGFMLSLAVYGIARFIPVLNSVDRNFTRHVLIVFGTLSLAIGAISIAFQSDIKRLLAYSSIEHIGIITLALGLGPVGAYAAFFHTMNHSLCKTFAFMSAGSTGQIFGTYEMKGIKNLLTSSWWGITLFISLLALIGMAPFAVFMSKLQVIRAMVLNSQWILLILFVCATVFVFIEILRHLMRMTGRAEKQDTINQTIKRPAILDCVIIITLLTSISVVGFWLPYPLKNLLMKSAAIISGSF